MMSPFWALLSYTGNMNLHLFVEQVTTLQFWISGNYYNMWYIAVSIILYLLFPCMFYYIFKEDKSNKIVIKGILVMMSMLIACVFANECLANASPFIVTQWTVRSILFPIGIVSGYLCYKKKSISFSSLTVFLLFSLFLMLTFKMIEKYYLSIDDARSDFYYGLSMVFRVMFFLPIITQFLCSCNLYYFKRVLRWCGKYSLELYLIHSILYYLPVKVELGNDVKVLIAVLVSILICQPVHIAISKVESYFFDCKFM